MISPELQEKILCWQQKIADNTITQEELKEALAYLRSQRNKAFSPEVKASRSVTSEGKPRAKAEKAPAIDTKALLASLFGKKEEPPAEE